MVFVDKPRNSLTSSPARYLAIGSGYLFEIESGFRLVIEAAVESTDWTESTRNSTLGWSDKTRET